MAKTTINSRTELLYLLFFYIWEIKSVKSVEKIKQKRTDLRDENRGINAVLVDMCSKIVEEQEKISLYGKILVNENKVINNYLINID